MSVTYIGSNPADQSLALLPDGELVELAQKGRRAAFESLFFRHQNRIYTLALGIVGNVSDARDVVQETFLKTYMRLARLRKDGAVLAYLCRTATNASIDVLRSRRGMQGNLSVGDKGMEIASNAPGPEAVYEQHAAHEALARALLALSPEHRLVIVLHHLDGQSLEDIAARIKVPVGTVKSRLGRAREALKRKLTGKVTA
jgi:RNA polymerase sigma-70 factor (ECF subfamily)